MQDVELTLIDTAIAAFKTASSDVQAALIGNLGIVFAALLTMIVTAVIATRQFRHERKEKAKDRALELKKEVLLDGVRGAQSALSSLGAIASLKKIEDALSDFQSGMGRIHTASVVANSDTVRAGKEFIDKVGPFFLRLVAERSPVESMQTNFNLKRQMIDSIIAENKLLLSRQRDAAVSGNADEATKLGAVLQMNFSRFDELDKEADALWAEFQPRHIELIRTGLEMQAEVAPLLRNLIASVRIDIGVDETSEAYFEAARADDRKPLQVFEELMPALIGITSATALPAPPVAPVHK
jgi:hypothetical protein